MLLETESLKARLREIEGNLKWTSFLKIVDESVSFGVPFRRRLHKSPEARIRAALSWEKDFPAEINSYLVALIRDTNRARAGKEFSNGVIKEKKKSKKKKVSSLDNRTQKATKDLLKQLNRDDPYVIANQVIKNQGWSDFKNLKDVKKSLNQAYPAAANKQELLEIIVDKTNTDIPELRRILDIVLAQKKLSQNLKYEKSIADSISTWLVKNQLPENWFKIVQEEFKIQINSFAEVRLVLQTALESCLREIELSKNIGARAHIMRVLDFGLLGRFTNIDTIDEVLLNSEDTFYFEPSYTLEDKYCTLSKIAELDLRNLEPTIFHLAENRKDVISVSDSPTSSFEFANLGLFSQTCPICGQTPCRSPWSCFYED